MTSPELDRTGLAAGEPDLRRAPAWRRLALVGALAAVVHQACALNPQPIPPDEVGATASDGGRSGSSSGNANPGSSGSDGGESSSGSSGAVDDDAGDGGNEDAADAGDAGTDDDAGTEDAGDGDAG